MSLPRLLGGLAAFSSEDPCPDFKLHIFATPPIHTQLDPTQATCNAMMLLTDPTTLALTIYLYIKDPLEHILNPETLGYLDERNALALELIARLGVLLQYGDMALQKNVICQLIDLVEGLPYTDRFPVQDLILKWTPAGAMHMFTAFTPEDFQKFALLSREEAQAHIPCMALAALFADIVTYPESGHLVTAHRLITMVHTQFAATPWRM